MSKVCDWNVAEGEATEKKCWEVWWFFPEFSLRFQNKTTHVPCQAVLLARTSKNLLNFSTVNTVSNGQDESAGENFEAKVKKERKAETEDHRRPEEGTRRTHRYPLPLHLGCCIWYKEYKDTASL